MSKKALLCLILIVLTVAGCGPIPTPEQQFKEDLKTLDTAWQQGGEARRSLLSKGLTADDKSCREIYTATAASQHPADSKQFATKRQAYFQNGCLGLPRPGSASSSPSTLPRSPATTAAG